MGRSISKTGQRESQASSHSPCLVTTGKQNEYGAQGLYRNGKFMRIVERDGKQLIEGVTPSGKPVSIPFNSDIKEVEWERKSYFEDLNVENPEWRNNQFERHLYHLIFWTERGHEWTNDQKNQLMKLVEVVNCGQ